MSWGKMPAGSEAQPSRSATHQLLNCRCAGRERRVSWAEVEGGPCAAPADLQGRLSQEFEVVQEKMQGYLLKIWANRQGRTAVHESAP